MIMDMYIEPQSGEFDIEPIEAVLEAMPLTVRDAKKRTTFMVATDQHTVDEVVRERELDDKGFPSAVLLIDVHPKRIDVSYRTLPVESGRAFVAWMRDHYSVRVRDEDYNDVTEQLDANLEFIFGQPL